MRLISFSLILHLSQYCSRAEPQAELLLYNAAFHRHGRMLAGRRVAQLYELADIVRYAGRCIVAAVSTVLCAVFLVAGTQVKSVPFAVIVLAGGAGALYLSQSSF